MKTLNTDELLKFWKIIRPIYKNEYIEIRFTDRTKPPKYYQVVDRFMFEHADIIVKKKCQFFIQRFEELLRILTYDNNYLLSNHKICYSLCLREFDEEGNIAGGYNHTKNARFVFFDIDKTDHSNLEEHEKELLDKRVEQVVELLKLEGLHDPTIVNSGAGRHLLYKIEPQEITEAKRKWYRNFVIDLKFRLSDENFELDGIYDFTRVFGLPETYNIKRKARVFVQNYGYTTNNFKIKWQSGRKKTSKRLRIEIDDKKVLPKIRESLEWEIITKPDKPIGEVNKKIFFALKLLIKETGVENVNLNELEKLINVNEDPNNKWVLDIEQGTQGCEYSPGTAINWCKDNDEWCKKNGIDWRRRYGI